MPTGYTADVQGGKVTDFSAFAMQCARAFGALIMMRDDPADAPIKDFEPSMYNLEAKRKAEAELMALRSMTVEEIRAAYRAEQDKATRYRDEYLQRKETERVRYEAMLAKVRAWEPPTAEHVGLKTFMVEQLVESIKFDCGGDWTPEIPYDGPDKWWQEQVSSAERAIARHAAEHEKEIERTEGRNRWVRELRASLPLSESPAQVAER